MWINLIGFNLLWAGLVLLGNSFVLVAIVALLLHFYFCKSRIEELKVVATIAAIGVSVDSVLTQLNIFIFDNAILIPLWLAVLWCCFAATIRHSLSFLSRSKWLQVAVGGCFAPLSYVAGERFGAVDFSLPFVNTYILLSVIWALLMTLFFTLNDKMSSKEIANASFN